MKLFRQFLKVNNGLGETFYVAVSQTLSKYGRDYNRKLNLALFQRVAH